MVNVILFICALNCAVLLPTHAAPTSTIDINDEITTQPQLVKYPTVKEIATNFTTISLDHLLMLAGSLEEELKEITEIYVSAISIPFYPDCNAVYERESYTYLENIVNADTTEEDIRRAAAHLLLLHREITNTAETGDKSLLKDGCEDDMNTGNLCDYNCIQGREVDQKFHCKNRRDILPYIANLSKQLEIQFGPINDYLESVLTPVDGTTSTSELELHNMIMSCFASVQTETLREYIEGLKIDQ
ncbi:hypothetical protein CAPTEDRAFT_211329 [Capitella teleta]|uniref:Uncharacterized protein n=1 Tax=Capitella teleta TaxID=283909 RepID=R7V2D1_CAPTE|nr:hypothetical protein CAPTEDRAFT_211329 [Capitella teleta]|eukprot:ELU12664.1 hypothetical protein CAPTEDRAFT_211329 [Capitella teleta]